MTENTPYDIAIIGGGINGAGIARDAAGRGLSVFLCEKDDLASATSSASTKLIHGGLRYLEHHEFRLVREALKEREVLWQSAPHIIWPLRFVLPHIRDLRPAWLIRTGLFLYDHLGGRKLLPKSSGIRFSKHPTGIPLKAYLKKGFVYSDCWVQDARLVVLNAMDAREKGADVRTRHECVRAKRIDSLWEVTVLDTQSGVETTIRARSLVNATGPWCDRLIADALKEPPARHIRLVKGSHIVVPKLFDHDYCYIFQNPDGRIVFAIPYEQDYTLIGTTDVDFEGAPGTVAISDEETAYLCDVVNQYFEKQTAPGDVAWSYAGVRPLFGDDSESASSVSRDYTLDLETQGGQAPLLNVYGGKITTYRKLAEQALHKLSDALGIPDAPWTAAGQIPGGDFDATGFKAFLQSVRDQYPWLPPKLAHRWARNYGTRLHRIVGGATSLDGLGARLGDDLFENEVIYLIEHEWARTAHDILWRRSKLGLHLSKTTIARLDDWLAEHTGLSPERREKLG